MLKLRMLVYICVTYSPLLIKLLDVIIWGSGTLEFSEAGRYLKDSEATSDLTVLFCCCTVVGVWFIPNNWVPAKLKSKERLSPLSTAYVSLAINEDFYFTIACRF